MPPKTVVNNRRPMEKTRKFWRVDWARFLASIISLGVTNWITALGVGKEPSTAEVELKV
jgi:hypothetical protein